MKVFHQFLISVILALVTVSILANIYLSEKPQLANGDLIFQTGLDGESAAVIAATGSKFTRIGIVKKIGEGDMVISMNDGYAEIPFDQFVSRGIFHRYSIYRYRKLDPDRAMQITTVASALGKYNDQAFFNFGGSELYPSEAAYLAYRKSGLDVGNIQKIRDLNVGTLMLKNIIQANWQDYPACQGSVNVDKAKTPEECRQIIEGQDVITPVSLTEDMNFELVYSNYPL